MGLSLSKFEGVSPKKNVSTLHSFFGRKPDTAKHIECRCAEREEASCSGSNLPLNGPNVLSNKQEAAHTDAPTAVPVLSSTEEASGNGNMVNLSKLPGSSLSQLGCEGEGLINVSGMFSKQMVCLHSEINTDTESCTNVKAGDGVSQLLYAAGLNQGVFDSLPSDIQGEIIRDLSARQTHSPDEVGLSNSAPHPCEECGILVPQSEAQVHADYHMAAQLSAVLQREGRSHSTGDGSEETSTSTQTASSRKRPSSSQCNPLSKYFKPSKH